MDDSTVEADCADLRRGGFGVFVVGRTVVGEGVGSEFPRYGELVAYRDATVGKKGGVGGDGGGEGGVQGYGYDLGYVSGGGGNGTGSGIATATATGTGK